MARESDLVLVHIEDKPAFFARIECIEPDVKRDWHKVHLLILQVPLAQVAWILRQEYIDGASFTMGGRKVVLERVVAPDRKPPPEEDPRPERPEGKSPDASRQKGKVISLFPKR